MFKFLQRLLGHRGNAVRAAPALARTPRGATPARPPATGAKAAVLEATARPRINRDSPPEALCGLTPGMSTDEIRERLALLYRRHNRAASSLEAEMREEAEIMLDAVVRCRETFFGVPKSDPPEETTAS